MQQIKNETPIEISVVIAAITKDNKSVVDNIGDTTTQAVYDENDRPSPLDDMGMEKTNNLVTVQVTADTTNIGDTNQAVCDRDDNYRAIYLDDVGMEKNNNLVTVPPNTTTRKKGKEKTVKIVTQYTI